MPGITSRQVRGVVSAKNKKTSGKKIDQLQSPPPITGEFQMTPEQEALLAAAEKAALKAYAPYSRFRVGAAVLTDRGTFIGANIENSSSNLGICAERVALSHALMHDAETIHGIGVCCIDAPPGESTTVNISTLMPCGGCRQWLAELAPGAWLVTKGVAKVFNLDDLLPSPFAMTL